MSYEIIPKNNTFGFLNTILDDFMYPMNTKKVGDRFGIFDDERSERFSNLYNLRTAKPPKPDIRLHEEDNCHKFTLAAPGVDKEDFKLSLKNRTLVLSYTSSEKKSEFFNFQSFSRTWEVGQGTTHEDISADYADGILTIAVNKVTATDPQSAAIEIK